MKKNILVFINYNTYFENLFGVIQLLKKNANFNVQASFPEKYESLIDHQKKIEDLGIECFAHDGSKISSSFISSIINPQKTKINTKKHEIKKNYSIAWFRQEIRKFLREIFYAVIFSKNVINRVKIVKALIRNNNIDLIIVGGNPVASDTSWIIEAAKQEKIKAAAFVNWLGYLEGVTMSAANPDHRLNTFLGTVVRFFFPKWIYEIDGKQFSRIPPYQIIPMEIMRMSPCKPWVLHDGFLDKICVEGEAMKAKAIKFGLEPNKVVACGSPFHDEIFHILEEKDLYIKKLYDELGMTHGKPLMLVAIPPDFLYPINGVPQCPKCDFQDYGDLVNFWGDVVASAKNYNIVIAPHPATPNQKLKHLERLGIRISNWKSSNLIPLADVYVACVSATIGIAITSGVPVINYDVYRFNYDDYTNFKGVVHIQEKDDFKDVITKINSEQVYLKELKTFQNHDSDSYSKIDGCAHNRIIKVIEELI
jgi:hypothetical protein